MPESIYGQNMARQQQLQQQQQQQQQMQQQQMQQQQQQQQQPAIASTTSMGMVSFIQLCSYLINTHDCLIFWKNILCMYYKLFSGFFIGQQCECIK